MHVLSVSKANWNVTKRRKNNTGGKHWKLYYFDDEEHRFRTKSVDWVQAKMLSLKKEHRLIRICRFCNHRAQYIMKSKSQSWKCGKCYNVNHSNKL